VVDACVAYRKVHVRGAWSMLAWLIIRCMYVGRGQEGLGLPGWARWGTRTTQRPWGTFAASSPRLSSPPRTGRQDKDGMSG